MNRILLISTTASPIGGVETWLDRCCQYLAVNGMEPIVGLVRGQTYNIPEKFRLFHPTLDTVEIDGRGLNAEGRVRALMRCIRKVRPATVLPMSVVEANDAVIRCKKAGDDLRLVVHAQGNLPAMLADLHHYKPGIDHIVCPGRLTQNMLTSWGAFPPSRVTHIPNGADQASHPQVKNSGTIRLGYVGRFTQDDKRVLDLVELHHNLTVAGIDFTLNVVGAGPAGDQLRSSLSQFDNVTFPGPMSHEQLYREVFPNLDVLVLCSDSEAFGIVLAEAMMHGVVPVTSQYMGYHSEQLVLHGETGLSFPVGDMAAAATHVESLSKMPETLASMSQNCVAHAMNCYTWQRSLGRWHDLLSKVCATPPSAVSSEYQERTKSQSGRLDALGIPGVTDWIRRCRRFIVGSSVPDCGEEWPLYWQDYPKDLLDEVAESCRVLDQQSKTFAATAAK